MYKQSRIYIVAFLLLALLTLPTISLPFSAPMTFTSTTFKRSQDLSQSDYNSISSISYPTPLPVVNLDKSNFTGDIVLRYDSVVEIKNSFMGNSSFLRMYYLYNNSWLILDNVTFLAEVNIYLYDTSVLIIKNANFSIWDVDIYLRDHSRLYIYNSTMQESDVKCYDNSSAYIYNTDIDYLYATANSTLSAENVTIFSTMYLYGFSQVTLKNSNTTFHIKGYQNVTLTIDNTTSTKSIYLSDNATLFLRNSTFENLFISGRASKAVIVNSTLVSITQDSGVIAEIYNSTINTVYRGFIIYGKGTYKNDILEMSSGTFQYNVMNDSDTVITNIQNRTTFHLMPNANLTISQITAVINNIYTSKAYLFINSSTNVWYLCASENSKVHLFNTTLITSMLYNSNEFINKTYIGTLNTYGSTVNMTYSIIESLRSYQKSTVIGANCKIGTIYMAESSFVTSYTSIVFSIAAYLGSALNITYGLLNETTLNFYNTSFFVGWVNLSYTTIDMELTTFVANDSLMESTIIYSLNSSLQLSNCTSPSSRMELDASTLTIVNSTLKEINLYTNSSTYIQKNSTIDIVFVDPSANAIVEIVDSRVTSVNINTLSSRGSAINSNIQNVFYILEIHGGIVNITDNKVISSGGSDYNSSFVYDSKTNITNFFLMSLFVDSASVHIINQSVTETIYITNSEAYLYNVTAKTLFFSGSTLNINQGDIDNILISYTSDTSMNINGTTATFLYTGISYNLTYTGMYLTRGAVYGNITFSQIFTVLIYDGVVGISNNTITYVLAGPFGKIYVYNTTITGYMYQTYIFTHDGIVQGNNVTGYSEIGVLNVTNNNIADVDLGFIVNLNGTLIINSSKCVIIGYNNSQTKVYSSVIYGFEFHDSAVGYFNDSNVQFFDFAPNLMTDNTKLYCNNTEISVITMYNQSYFEGLDVTFTASSFSVYINSTIELRDNSKMLLQNSTLSTSRPRVVTVIDFATFLARNVSINADITTVALYVSGHAKVSWNESIFTMDPPSTYSTLMAFYDHSEVTFTDVFVNVTSSSSITVYINVYNFTRFTVRNFNFSETTNVHTSIAAYDLSLLNLDNLTATSIYTYDNSSLTVFNSYISGFIEVCDNSTGTLQNDKYNIHTIELYIYGENAELTVINTTVVYAEVYGTLNLYNIGNDTASTIIIESSGRLFADNLTANTISITYQEPEYPYLFSVLNNTKADNLIFTVTTHKTGDINFTGTSFTASPASSLFKHVNMDNVTATKKKLCLNIMDNTKVNGTDAEITYLYVGFIVDTTAPTISVSPSALSTEAGVPNQVIEFTIYEDNPDIYVVSRNGTIIMSGHYDNGSVITVVVSGFSAGVWEVVLTANDTSGNTASSTSFVTVYPSEPPVFTAKPPRTYNMINGTTGNVLNWTATDNSPSFYEIYVNGTLVTNSTWTSGTPIEFNIDSLDVGTYNVTIVLHDEVGNTAKDTVTVVVSVQGVIPGIEGIPLEYLIIGVVVLLLAIVAVVIVKKRKGKTTPSKTKRKRKAKTGSKKRKK